MDDQELDSRLAWTQAQADQSTKDSTLAVQYQTLELLLLLLKEVRALRERLTQPLVISH